MLNGCSEPKGLQRGLGTERYRFAVLHKSVLAEKEEDLRWLWFGGFVITTTHPNILRDLDKTDLCSLLYLKSRKQNGAQDPRKLSSLSLQRGGYCAATGRFWTDGSRDSHLSAFYNLRIVTFTSVCSGQNVTASSEDKELLLLDMCCLQC